MLICLQLSGARGVDNGGVKGLLHDWIWIHDWIFTVIMHHPETVSILLHNERTLAFCFGSNSTGGYDFLTCIPITVILVCSHILSIYRHFTICCHQAIVSSVDALLANHINHMNFIAFCNPTLQPSCIDVYFEAR